MEKYFEIFIVWIMSYLIGSFLWGPVIVRMIKGCAYEVDLFYLFHHESCNPGATNVGRVLGKQGKIATIILDALKGMLAAVLASWLKLPLWAVAVSGFCAILGHAFPIYYLFKGYHGGKAVATTLGVFLALSVKITLIALLLYAAIGLAGKKLRSIPWAKFARISSVRSLTTCFFFATLTLLLDRRIEVVTLALVATLLVIWLHRSNIDRLIKGVEIEG